MSRILGNSVGACKETSLADLSSVLARDTLAWVCSTIGNPEKVGTFGLAAA